MEGAATPRSAGRQSALQEILLHDEDLERRLSSLENEGLVRRVAELEGQLTDAFGRMGQLNTLVGELQGSLATQEELRDQATDATTVGMEKLRIHMSSNTEKHEELARQVEMVKSLARTNREMAASSLELVEQKATAVAREHSGGLSTSMSQAMERVATLEQQVADSKERGDISAAQIARLEASHARVTTLHQDHQLIAETTAKTKASLEVAIQKQGTRFDAQLQQVTEDWRHLIAEQTNRQETRLARVAEERRQAAAQVERLADVERSHDGMRDEAEAVAAQVRSRLAKVEQATKTEMLSMRNELAEIRSEHKNEAALRLESVQWATTTEKLTEKIHKLHELVATLQEKVETSQELGPLSRAIGELRVDVSALNARVEQNVERTSENERALALNLDRMQERVTVAHTGAYRTSAQDSMASSEQSLSQVQVELYEPLRAQLTALEGVVERNHAQVVAQDEVISINHANCQEQLAVMSANYDKRMAATADSHEIIEEDVSKLAEDQHARGELHTSMSELQQQLAENQAQLNVRMERLEMDGHARQETIDANQAQIHENVSILEASEVARAELHSEQAALQQRMAANVLQLSNRVAAIEQHNEDNNHESVLERQAEISRALGQKIQEFAEQMRDVEYRIGQNFQAGIELGKAVDIFSQQIETFEADIGSGVARQRMAGFETRIENLATVAGKCVGDLESRITEAVLQVTREASQEMDEKMEQLVPFKEEMKAVTATMSTRAQSILDAHKVEQDKVEKVMITLRQQMSVVKSLLIMPEEPVSMKLLGVPIVRGVENGGDEVSTMHARQQLGQAVLKALAATGGVSTANVSHVEVLTPDLSATIVSVFFEDNEGARHEQLCAAEQVAMGKVSVAFQGQHLLAKPIPRMEARADAATGHTCSCSKCHRALSSLHLQSERQEQQLSDLADIVEQDAAANLAHIGQHRDQLANHMGRLDHLYHVTGTALETDPAGLAVRDESTIRRTASQIQSEASQERVSVGEQVEGLIPTLSSKSPCPRPVRVVYRGSGDQRQKLTYTLSRTSSGEMGRSDGLGLQLVTPAPTPSTGRTTAPPESPLGEEDQSTDSVAGRVASTANGKALPTLPPQFQLHGINSGSERAPSLSSSVRLSNDSVVALDDNWKYGVLPNEGVPPLSPVVRSRSPVLRKTSFGSAAMGVTSTGNTVARSLLTSTDGTSPSPSLWGNTTPPLQVRDWYDEEAQSL